MPGRISEYRTFWREFRQTFHTTGAVLPSGRLLCRALARQIGRSGSASRILEVGPGTGVVTQEILQRMLPQDCLDLVEINPRFAAHLRRRFAEDARWQPFADRIRVLEMPIEELPTTTKYNHIVSGLPLNNFDCAFVKRVLEHFHKLAGEGCTLSFFEYVAIRKLKAVVSSAAERRRLLGIEQLLRAEFAAWEIDRQCVLMNVPPAWVHHLRFAEPIPTAEPASGIQPVTC